MNNRSAAMVWFAMAVGCLIISAAVRLAPLMSRAPTLAIAAAQNDNLLGLVEIRAVARYATVFCAAVAFAYLIASVSTPSWPWRIIIVVTGICVCVFFLMVMVTAIAPLFSKRQAASPRIDFTPDPSPSSSPRREWKNAPLVSPTPLKLDREP